MIWPFSQKSNTSSHLGIDIGTTSIKIVEIEKLQGALRGKLLNYGVLTSSNYIHKKPTTLTHVEGVAILESEVIAMLQNLLQQFGGHTKDAVLSIPAFSSFVDEVLLPPMPVDEMASAISFEARSHVPVPMSEVELTWQLTRQDERGASATIITVPKEILFRYRNICQQLGLRLVALELETFSIVRALNLYSEESLLILDIGARNTNLSIVAKGLLHASHNIETSGRDMTNMIAQGLGVAPKRAEELKRAQGLSLAANNPAIADMVYGSVDKITEEARRIIESKGLGKVIKRVILTGGSAATKHLPEYLQKKLGLSLDIALPWATIEYNPTLTSALKANGSSFTVAVGLSLY